MTAGAVIAAQPIAATDVPIPMDNPAVFYIAFVGGVATPGAIPPGGVSDWELVFDWDVKKGKGLNDATITDEGTDPPTGKIKYQVWRRGTGIDPNDFSDDVAFVDMLIAAKANNQALDISHPMINQLRAAQVVPKKIGQLTDEGGMLFTRTLEFLKWVPQPTSAGGTPGGANDHDPNNPETSDQANDPNKEQRQEFLDKLNEASQ